ncbi:MAG: CoA transferase [Gammaproteobacteria bacterium]|nr:CoA transferase [Gammaproteobacteria bacterium]
MSYPLEGLKVLDFSRVLAGPFAGRMLNDLGADVVKVEPPDGDVTRLWGKVIADIPGYFHQQNVGKRNICIDLRAVGAKDLVGELVAQADILIENYRPDVMGRLGIGYEALRRINPRLIQLSISGFGHNGPESRRPAYAPVVHAEAGLTHRSSRRGNIPYRDLPLSVADTNASLHGLVALLSAVIMRSRTGRGQHIDIAMMDVMAFSSDGNQAILRQRRPRAPRRPRVRRRRRTRAAVGRRQVVLASALRRARSRRRRRPRPAGPAEEARSPPPDHRVDVRSARSRHPLRGPRRGQAAVGQPPPAR